MQLHQVFSNIEPASLDVSDLRETLRSAANVLRGVGPEGTLPEPSRTRAATRVASRLEDLADQLGGPKRG